MCVSGTIFVGQFHPKLPLPASTSLPPDSLVKSLFILILFYYILQIKELWFLKMFSIYHLILVWIYMCCIYVCIYRVAWEFTHFEGSNPSVGHILSSSNCFTNIENYSASLVVIKCPLPDLSSYFTFLLPATFCLFWVHVFFKWQSFAAILWNT